MKFDVHLQSVALGARTRVVELERQGSGYSVKIDGVPVNADAMQIAPNTISVLLDGQAFEVHVTPSLDGTIKLQSGPHEFMAELRDPRAWQGRKHGASEVEGRQQILAPMPGKVIRLLVNVGDEVEAGQGLVVVEAMKMQNEIRSPKTGKVERLQVKEGQAVNAGEVLCVVV
ncbi:MAG TPA: biotin/lipoyl-containing protein [Candidatus Saccharimonadales bacterium]|nr:biotin/lipoyl-containing protein [Candidatus Saccharimonadales bacterium]